MFLQSKQHNRHTIGKWLRRQKHLRERDPVGKVTPMPMQLECYTEDLRLKGVQMHHLTYATFRTKNGLPYPGLMATGLIPSNTIMLRVPAHLLLNTRTAFLSDVRPIFQQNPLFFSKLASSDWEDRILLVYLLREYQKNKTSSWYGLIKNLPRDIDYVIFWNQHQLSLLEDPFFTVGIQNERNKYQREEKQLREILHKYPALFDSHTICQENIRWIHIHLVSRCFGKYFKYTTMVPFAELFNHQCTDVYYSMDYNQNNPYNKHQQFYQQKELTAIQIQQNDTSDGSYDEDDFYLEQEIFKIEFEKGQPLKQFSISNQNKKTIKQILLNISSLVSFNDNISLGYISTIYEAILAIVIANDYKKLNKIIQCNAQYISMVKEYNKNLPSYSKVVNQKKVKNNEVVKQQYDKNKVYFNSQWKEEQFDQFLMLCSTKDQFQQGSQVYFCYGRLPNNLLLLRYGFALEHNKYNHVFLRLETTPRILQSPLLWWTASKEVNVSLYERFKIKRTEMNVELLTCLRCRKWRVGEPISHIFYIVDLQKETQVLLEARQLYIQQLKKYKNTVQENQTQLTDKTLNYHQHFALIYRLEQQRIFMQQIDLIRYAIRIIEQVIKNHLELKEILSQEKNASNLTQQIMMRKYFSSFKV